MQKGLSHSFGRIFWRHPKRFLLLATLIVLLGFSSIGAGASYWYFVYRPTHQVVEEKKDVFMVFTEEIYDTIKQNYWEKASDEQLANLYKLALQKVTEKDQVLGTNDKAAVMGMVQASLAGLDESKKKEIVARLGDVVLANLKPFGRSRLLASKQVQDLVNTVTNVDPNSNLYGSLGVSKDAPQAEIEKAYESKIEELKPQKETPEGKEKIAQVERAYEALATLDKRKDYDEKKVEPTVTFKKINSTVAYSQIKKVSPQTFDEFQKAADAFTDERVNSLILDLRGNIGGAIDILPNFLGPFIGPGQYAYEFFHQGEYTPFKTKTGWMPSLVKFKKVAILVDDKSQSSAEVMAATLKKYNVGVLIGTKTKGWGTIEQIMPLKTQLDPSEKYSMLIVHSLTIRDDGQPIEANGVEPVINIKNPNWEKDLSSYFESAALISAVKEMLK